MVPTVPRLCRPAARLLLAIACGAASLHATAPRFYADDPIAREPESQDASRAQAGDIGLMYDISYNLFVTPRLQPANTPAGNINTIDELPDSGWFTNRILPRRLSEDDLARGPHVGEKPNPERWTVIREKSSGYSPGFTARDANGETWFVSFDAPGYAEGATAAIVIASKLFWALGYNQVETYITTVDPQRLVIDSGATMRRPNGKRTPMRRGDVDAVLERAARSADGTYRAAAARLLPGKVLGPFRYEGTRPDDPNDIVEHQNRRELRALRVFGAWANLTDLKAGNTLDTLVTVDGRAIVRHYLQDVGSTFGIGANGAHDWDEGFEYFYQPDTSRRRMLSFGFALSPWQTAHYTEYPSVGRFESEAFDPLTWKPHAPTTAYMAMQPEDAFWAARRVAAFDNGLIRAIVHAGQFSDSAAEQYLTAMLMQRRDKIARAYLTAVNPLVDPALSADGQLTFTNAATGAGPTAAPARYVAQWSRFDNATNATSPLGESDSTSASIKAPAPLPGEAGAFVQIDVRGDGGGRSEWQQAVRLHFRRAADGWVLVGLDRRAPRQGS